MERETVVALGRALHLARWQGLSADAANRIVDARMTVPVRSADGTEADGRFFLRCSGVSRLWAELTLPADGGTEPVPDVDTVDELAARAGWWEGMSSSEYVDHPEALDGWGSDRLLLDLASPAPHTLFLETGFFVGLDSENPPASGKALDCVVECERIDVLSADGEPMVLQDFLTLNRNYWEALAERPQYLAWPQLGRPSWMDR